MVKQIKIVIDGELRHIFEVDDEDAKSVIVKIGNKSISYEEWYLKMVIHKRKCKCCKGQGVVNGIKKKDAKTSVEKRRSKCYYCAGSGIRTFDI